MAINTYIITALAVAAIMAAGGSPTDAHLLEGKQPRLKPSQRPVVRASFPRVSAPS